MPPHVVTGQDLDDVAAYVGKYAGVPGAAPPKVPGGPGAQVFANNGCGGCHTLAAAKSGGVTGPNLDEVLPGQSAAMIEESIVDPNAKIAKGYPANVMPQNFGRRSQPERNRTAGRIPDRHHLGRPAAKAAARSRGRLSPAAARPLDHLWTMRERLETASRSRRSATRRSPLVALGALALIVLTGAGVRLTDSGLGCPDWPKCYGQTVPPLESHAVIEYGNRVLTGFVGIAVIAASVLAFFRRPYRWHLALFGALLPLGVIGQAILGALVVKYHLAPGLVMSHFILSMLLLDAAFALAWCSRYEPWERRRSTRPPRRLGGARPDPARPADDRRRHRRDRLRPPRRRPRRPARPPLHLRGREDAGMGRPAPRRDRDRLRPRRDRASGSSCAAREATGAP